jgi:voltage-gated potassium channel
MQVPIVVSAVLPLVIVPESNGWVGAAVGVVTWLVFLVDFAVHAWRREGYWRTGLGAFDLFVVLATAPWFLIPGASAGQFVVLLRLARLARLVMATRGARRLFERLGQVAVVAAGVVLAGSLVAYHAEHPTNPGFATIGDALWWGIVSLTTVGYGDIVPKTGTGRWAGVTIMLTGIAVLGLLAGSLASFFRLDEAQSTDGAPTPASTDAAETSSDLALQALAAEVSALRRQVEALGRQHEGDGPGGPAPHEPADAEAPRMTTP